MLPLVEEPQTEATGDHEVEQERNGEIPDRNPRLPQLEIESPAHDRMEATEPAMQSEYPAQPEMGQFYYSAKAFDVLERLDPNPEYWEGKRGACVGIFQMIIACREPKDTLREVLHLLRSTGNPQVEYIVRIMKKWAKENRVPI
ncbi:UNVERIFIED_CONTAM: hypothetical protein K2H54_074509 [Gekko kuhli]